MSCFGKCRKPDHSRDENKKTAEVGEQSSTSAILWPKSFHYYLHARDQKYSVDENSRGHIDTNIINHFDTTVYFQTIGDYFSAGCSVCDTAWTSAACPYYTQNSRNAEGEKTPLYD